MKRNTTAFPDHHRVVKHATYKNPGLIQDLFRGPIAKAVIPGQSQRPTRRSDRPLRRPGK